MNQELTEFKLKKSIGVFDSGVGGLTVLKELMAAFPQESFIYVGDTARVPYGGRSRATLKKYAQECVCFLEDHGAKAIVVACNSASTVMRELSASTPIFGVIEPSARLAVAKTVNHSIGVIGTKATIQQKSYVQEIQKISSSVHVYQQACPLLVPLVEEGWDTDPITNLIVYRYLSPLLSAQIDTLILGCTHYPILKHSIQKVLGNSVTLIESSEPLIEDLKAAFFAGHIETSTARPELLICATDKSELFTTLARRILTQTNLPPIQQINL